ncbi:MAG: FAD-dependent oxidoreductase [Chloroflexi bacterium]|nr:FAD-dependent oxidoreductase [Chloroflexota bacterium]
MIRIGAPDATGIHEPARTVEVVREVDVLVVGGGTSGCAAAVAAARRGARTLLLDRYGFLGGTATAAMVGCLCGPYTCSPNTIQIIEGYLRELTDGKRSGPSGRRVTVAMASVWVRWRGPGPEKAAASRGGQR